MGDWGGPESPGGELEPWGVGRWGRSAWTPEALRWGRGAGARAADQEPKRRARASSLQGAQPPAGAPTHAPPRPSPAGPRPLSPYPERPSPLLHWPGRPGAPLASSGPGSVAGRPVGGARGEPSTEGAGMGPPSWPLPALSGAGGGGREGGEVTLSQRNRESPRDAPPRPLLPSARCAAPTAVWALPLRGALGTTTRGREGQSPALGKGDSLVRKEPPFKIRSSTLVIRTVQEIKQGLGKSWVGAPQNQE